MAQDSWPAPSHNAGALTEYEWERVAMRATDDGVHGDPLDSAVVVSGTGLQVTVKAEKSASVRGHAWYAGTTDYTHAITANTSGSTRLDRVVLRLDRTDWTVRSVVKMGTPGAGRPGLQQDNSNAGVFEIPLATVTIANNASSVTVAREELYVGSRIRPCTSTTRPTIPFRGQTVFETDTNRMVYWNGTQWLVGLEDTGWVTLTTPSVAWVPFGPNIGRKRNGVVSLRLALERTGTTLPSTTGGSQLAVLPTSLWPTDHFEYFPAVISGTGSSWRVEVRTDGTIWIEHGSADVTPGRNLNLTCTYIA